MFWFVLPLGFFLGFLANEVFRKYVNRSQGNVNKEYFKGLNFLLNEQPDKAIEVFIKVLDVDNETVELHLSLGNLFRRKGEVDRATRIHQNLIARQNLSDEHRLQSIYELAQDYYVAGLFDRAENLFIELKDTSVFHQYAVEGLLNIYQKQKDWHKAIATIEQLRPSQRKNESKRSAHYWCEIAELAINEKRFDDANKALRKSLSECQDSARATLLQGELSFQQGDYVKAIQLWQKLDSNHAALSELIIDKMIESYQKLNDDSGLKQYLGSLLAMPKKQAAFELWLDRLQSVFNEEQADSIFYGLLENDTINKFAADYLDKALINNQITQKQLKILVNLLLAGAKNKNIEYTCTDCGFDVGTLHWHCPSCGEWDSFI